MVRLKHLGDGVDDEGGKVERSGRGEGALEGEGGFRLGGEELFSRRLGGLNCRG